MPPRAIAVVHGMGDQQRGFSARFQRRLADRIATVDPDAEPIFQEIFWADILSRKQEQLFSRLEEENRLDFGRLRRFILEAMGDAIAYQPVSAEALASGELDVYARIHDRYAEALERLAGRAGEEAPLAVVAHSLGSVITSNYIWDCQKGRFREAAESPLARCQTVSHLLFLGSPLALWSLRYRDLGKPIEFPIADPEGTWINFYDPDDVLGYPVRAINRSYRRVVTADVAVNVGGILTSWNPLSHLAYWRDRDVLDGIARALAGEG